MGNHPNKYNQNANNNKYITLWGRTHHNHVV